MIAKIIVAVIIVAMAIVIVPYIYRKLKEINSYLKVGTTPKPLLKVKRNPNKVMKKRKKKIKSNKK